MGGGSLFLHLRIFFPTLIATYAVLCQISYAFLPPRTTYLVPDVLKQTKHHEAWFITDFVQPRCNV